MSLIPKRYSFYLIKPTQTHWDYSSSDTPSQQRQKLVAGFLDQKIIPLEWDPEEGWDGLPGHIPPPRVPTPEEIDLILQPYRSDLLRWRAKNMYRDHLCPVLLRTCYSTDEDERAKHDELMKKWIDVDIFGEEAWWAVLDNADLFNFGPDWHRVYEILPEVAGPLCPELDDRWTKRFFDPGHYDTMRSYFKKELANEKQNNPEAWKKDKDACIEEAAMALQKSATSTYVIITDEEAFQTGGLRVLYLDGFRNIIREGRMDPEIDDIFNVVSDWMETNDLLQGSTVGEKYRVNGELGRDLYQLTEDDLADAVSPL